MIEAIFKLAGRFGFPLPPRWSRMVVLHVFRKNGIGAEIGVHLGDYAARILSVARPKRLFLVDPWIYIPDEKYKATYYGGPQNSPEEMERRFQSVQRRFAAEITADRVNILRKPSAEAMAQIADGSLDFVYIDGNHDYEFVKEDLALSLRKVKPGGIIAGDDYSVAGWWKDGVKKAVDEFGHHESVQLLWILGDQFAFRKKS